MEEMVTVYLLGKKYSVPATLTIIQALRTALSAYIYGDA